ncbi:MAG: triple tyrosine motif-containing protein, partial [Bacteroidota bacterium]
STALDWFLDKNHPHLAELYYAKWGELKNDASGISLSHSTALDWFLDKNHPHLAELYYAKWGELKNDASGISLSLIPGSAGQVWALHRMGDVIWCGHDQGLFQISPRGMSPIFKEEGVLSMTSLNDDYLVTGTYNGLSLFHREGTKWTFEGKLPPIQGACSQVIASGDSLLWINIPNFGIIKATLRADFRIEKQRIYLFESVKGGNPWLQQDSMGVHLHTSLLSYTYNAAQDSFLQAGPRESLAPIVNRVPAIWSGLTLGESFLFFPVYNGFALYNNIPQPTTPQLPDILIRNLSAFNNDTTITLDPTAVLPYHLNNIRIEFLIPHQGQMRYRYQLVGFQDQWSEWSTQQHKDFLHLPEGEYAFIVEAQGPDGYIQSAPLNITIRPPWYRQWYILLCLGLIIVGSYFLQRWRSRRKLNLLKAQL